ncbi:RNA-directed DNA polymerase [Acidipila sp. EB88]|uniref:RNA-directed DNA polymerase n=1 Tax=Acidipila sp. EB88 TaxID=2305226 RepID=UPI002102BB76|nr:RNA-directed DNA polymerase [Acidipila sp. EB88]
MSRYGLSERSRLRALKRRGYKYLLKADLSQFYPTLYTHSIPWALHSKAASKSVLKNKAKTKSLGDNIDLFHMYMNDGQTHGIAIGPDISHITAEIVMAAVDQQLLHRYRSQICGFRYIDDFELSFETLSEAETVLGGLQSILSTFELSLNSRKTQIVDLPLGLEDRWAIDLNKFVIRNKKSPSGQRNDFISYFSTAFERASTDPASPILRYALARVQNENVDPKGWGAFCNCVLGAISADASTLPAALATLHKVATKGGHSIPKGPLGQVLNSVISKHSITGDGNEVAWALWASLAWSIPISAEAAKTLGLMEDDIVAILALDAESSGLIDANVLDKHAWSLLLNEDDAHIAEHWLLSYEATKRRWLSCSAVKNCTTFSEMMNAGVSFYSRRRNNPDELLKIGSIPGGRLPNFYA